MSVRARARLRAEPDGRGGSALPVLESDGPLALRRTRSPRPAYARVTVVGAMSAPLNGDHLAVEAQVADGARLIVDAAAATVALPGPRADADPSTYTVDLTVGGGGDPALAPRTTGLRERQAAPDHPGPPRPHRPPAAAR